MALGAGAIPAIVHPDDLPSVKSALSRLETSSQEEVEGRVMVNGAYRWTSNRMSLTRDKSGRPLYRDGSVRDITERKRVEENTRNEKLRLVIAQESAQAGVFEWDIKENRTVWSDQLKALYGFAPGEFKGFEDWSSRVHPDDLRYAKKAILEALTTGKYDVDFRIIWPDGSLHWLSARGKVIYDEQGRPLYMTGINMDITECKRAEEMLHASKRKIETILDSITDIFILYDQQWRFTDMNPQAEKSLGKSRAELIGKILWEMFPELKETEIYLRYLKAAETKIPEHFEAYSPATRNWQEYHAYPLEDGFSVYMRDINERKQAEAALRESQEKYKAIFDTSNDAFMLLDENRFLDCNSQTIRLYGFADKEEFIKHHPGDLSPVRQPDGRKSFPAAMEHIRNAFAQGYERFEWLHSRNNGEEFLADVTLSALTIKNRKVLQAVVRDITELKRAQEALQKSKEQLEEKVRERTAQLTVINKSLLAEIADRKRTETKLLSAQRNLRAMASEVVIAEERSRQHFATDLHDTVVQTLGAAKLRAQIIEDQIPKKARPEFARLQSMLSESILQARSIMSEMSPPVLNELGIKAALEWLSEEIGTKHKLNIDFNSSNSQGLLLPREIEVLLFQATRELLMNVVKHAHAQSARVKFSSRGRNIRIEVWDDGAGFDIRKTFQPDLKGGFGLYSIRERLRHIGGRLAIKSKPGQGTTVLITAPR